MRTDPKLLSGHNVYWIKFFLLAVFATMHVRDHARPAFHDAMGIDIDEYDAEVFRITSEITKQVFPLELDLENPALTQRFSKMVDISRKIDAATQAGGITGRLRKGWWMGAAGLNFVALYLIPTKKNEIPEVSRLERRWPGCWRWWVCMSARGCRVWAGRIWPSARP